MKIQERSKKAIITEVMLTIVSVGQIVLSIVLYKKDGHPSLRLAGWIVLWISAVFGWLPVWTFKKYGKVSKGKSYIYTTQLVENGIYRVMRHPQYFAGMLIGLALFLIAQHWLVGLLGLMCFIIYYSSSYDEEKAALRKFGEAYRDYMKRVPRFNFLTGLARLFKQKSTAKTD